LSASVKTLDSGSRTTELPLKIATELTQSINYQKQAVRGSNTIYMGVYQDLCTRILCLTTLLIQLSKKSRKKEKKNQKTLKGPSDSSRLVTGRLQTHNLCYLTLFSTDGKPRQSYAKLLML